MKKLMGNLVQSGGKALGVSILWLGSVHVRKETVDAVGP